MWLASHESLFPAPLILGLAYNLFGQQKINEFEASRCLKWSALSVIGLLCSYDCCEGKMPQLAAVSAAWTPQWGRSVAHLICTPADRLKSLGCIRLQLSVGLSHLIRLLSLTNLIFLLFLSQLAESEVAPKKVSFANFYFENNFEDDDCQGLNGLCSNLGFLTVGIFKNTPYTKTRCMQ